MVLNEGSHFPGESPLGFRRENFFGEPTHSIYDRDQWSIGYELKHRFNNVLSFFQNAVIPMAISHMLPIAFQAVR